MPTPEEKICRQPTAADLAEESTAEGGCATALSREAILDAPDSGTIRVPVPEWGGHVYVRTLTGEERDRFENLCATRRSGERLDIRGLKAELVVRCACDADGTPLFNAADARTLNRKAAKPIDRLFKAAQQLNGLTDEDVEELRGNSGGGLSGDSGSG